METVSSIGLWQTRSGFFNSWTASIISWDLMSSKNCFLIVKGRPANDTSASPSFSIFSISQPNCFMMFVVFDGAPIVTTAFTSSMSFAATRTAVPPKE